ncbi:hypothetical protein CPC08DRAFT_739048 [Agrocybe pediades]|nr:hypothetical protein CPC08DRAFT_739048 [Agrocybe pediades]
MSSISPPSAPHGSQLAWLDDAAAPVGYLSRKALPIKKNDAEPLNREDVQYDLLDYIFTDKHAVFTNPHPPVAGSKVTFADLYVSALYASSKCSKVLKEKMVEIPAFSIEFAKIALLTNVGRINTTMAFFPEMKTALRTYHPVPSLQKTEGNAQDAPRIKNCLKAAVVPSETQTSSPSTPEEVLAKLRAGQRPSTSVVNLVFVLANHAAPLAELHFDGHLNFLDLFLPNTRLASADRGRVFLWLLYHYLEDEHVPNPFDDAHSIKHANAVPRMRRLSTPELLQENVDTQEEIEFGIEMSQERNTFLQTLISSSEGERKFKINATTPHFVSGLNDGRAFLFYVPRPQDQMNANPPPPEPVTTTNNTTTTTAVPISPSTAKAWHLATSTDPLLDSDEEIMDEHARVDYSRRLSIIARLRKKPPPTK